MASQKKSEYLSIRVDPEIKGKIQELASSYGLDMTAFILLVIRNFMANKDWQENLKLVRMTPHEKIVEGLKQRLGEKEE